MTGSVLLEHLADTRRTYIDRTGKEPAILALGRWDVRELAQYIAANFTSLSQPSARELVRAAREGATIWEAEIKVDGRVARMPGALWWHP